MRIVLQKDVKGLGRKGDVKEVSDGYARNALLPRGIAVPASEGAVRHAADEKSSAERRERRIRKEAGRAARTVDGARIAFSERTASSGRLYASIPASRISDRIQERFGVRPSEVRLAAPIKEPGAHPVEVLFEGGAAATVTCVVSSAGEATG